MDVKHERVMFTGPTGSGKTTRLIEIVQNMLDIGVAADQIQVLVLNRQEAERWRKDLRKRRGSAVQVQTYFAFVQKELRRMWHVIETHVTDGTPQLEPIFLTMETAHYLMELCIEEMFRQGRFTDERFRSHPTRMALQLAETMQMAAISGLDTAEVAKRYKASWQGTNMPEILYEDVKATLEMYRERCLAHRLLDYGLSLELYNRVLLQEPHYQEILTASLRHLLVDDTEEILPAAFDFVFKVLPTLQTMHVSFCTDGGQSVFFGAHPELTLQHLGPVCREVKLGTSYTGAQDIGLWGEALAACLTETMKPSYYGSGVISHVAEDLRGQMLRKAGHEILTLLRGGAIPNDIVIVAPFIDTVTEHTLQTVLSQEGYTLKTLAHSRKIIELPFARALLTLLLVTSDYWIRPVAKSDIAHTLGLLLEIDPVRAMLLAEWVEKGAWSELHDLTLRKRIGFHAAAKYEQLRERLAVLKASIGQSLFEQTQDIFTMLLFPMGVVAVDAAACRHIAELARHFDVVAKVMLPEEKPLAHFIRMVEQGTIAAERRHTENPDPSAVYLATAYHLTMRKGSSFAYQCWLDTSRDAWMRSDAKEITNPHILSRRWEPGQVWTDAMNNTLRREKIARTVLVLTHRCRNGIIVAESACDSYGSEREGELASRIADL